MCFVNNIIYIIMRVKRLKSTILEKQKARQDSEDLLSLLEEAQAKLDTKKLQLMTDLTYGFSIYNKDIVLSSVAEIKSLIAPKIDIKNKIEALRQQLGMEIDADDVDVKSIIDKGIKRKLDYACDDKENSDRYRTI